MADKTVKFVQLIENYECLYNHTLQDYSRKDVTDKAWSDISRAMGMNWTVADCKERWKNIRNGFVRSLKPSPPRSSSKIKKLYYHHDIMQFVLPYLRPIQHSGNTCDILQVDVKRESLIPEEDDRESNSNDFDANIEQMKNETSHKQAKRKKEALTIVDEEEGRKMVRTEKDDVDIAVTTYLSEQRDTIPASDDRQMFLLSLLPDVWKLSEKNLRQFKIRTMIMLEEMITEQEQRVDL